MYRGFAHMNCNTNLDRNRKIIYVFFHNFSGYDACFLVKSIKRDHRVFKLSGLAYNTEKLRTVTLNSYRISGKAAQGATLIVFQGPIFFLPSFLS